MSEKEKILRQAQDKQKRFEKMKQIRDDVMTLKESPLYKFRVSEGNKPVIGEGSHFAKIMFIGEAPGKEEDLTGRPFIGRAGKLLTGLLEKNRINRKKVFITSVIKHRPSKNRKPKKSELLACEFWWEEQIKIIKPGLVVLLGKTAFDEVINQNKSFSEFRGKFLIKNKDRYFVTYHPAAGLRFPRVRKLLEKDFKKLGGTP